MTKLSVNINKIATLRNSRGGNNPDVVKVALDVERFGAQGITVHPRPDDRYMQMIDEVRPAQATLVPDPPHVLTSNAGWNTLEQKDVLDDIIRQIKSYGVRTSIFVEPDPQMIEGAAAVGTDRIELYTEKYARHFQQDRQKAVSSYASAARRAKELGLGINAGHDLDLNNLKFLKEQIPFLDEVSIGHALICDALYYGLENTVQMYLRQLI